METTATGLIVIGAVVGLVGRRVWLLLVPIPAALAGFAWYGWEFTDETRPYAIVIAASGYLGLALGALLRRRA